MGVREALETLAMAADADLGEVRSIRYIGRTGRVDVFTANGTVRVDVEPEDEPEVEPEVED